MILIHHIKKIAHIKILAHIKRFTHNIMILIHHINKELLCLRRKFSLKHPWAEIEFSNDAEGFVISIY